MSDKASNRHPTITWPPVLRDLPAPTCGPRSKNADPDTRPVPVMVLSGQGPPGEFRDIPLSPQPVLPTSRSRKSGSSPFKRRPVQVPILAAKIGQSTFFTSMRNNQSRPRRARGPVSALTSPARGKSRPSPSTWPAVGSSWVRYAPRLRVEGRARRSGIRDRPRSRRPTRWVSTRSGGACRRTLKTHEEECRHHPPTRTAPLSLSALRVAQIAERHEKPVRGGSTASISAAVASMAKSIP